MYLTAQVFLIVAVAGAYSWLLTVNGVAQEGVALIKSIQVPPWAVLLAINIFLLLVGMAVHAFFAVVLMMGSTPLAPDWYGVVRPPWVTDPLADSLNGGQIAWALAEVPLLFETGREAWFGKVIVVACAPDEQVRVCLAEVDGEDLVAIEGGAR